MINKIRPEKRLPLTNDYIFKKVFAKSGNEEILKDLLESVLEIKIQKVEVKNPELPKDILDKKAGILDIKVEINENQICDVELQVANQKNIEHRSVYYMGKLVAEQLNKREEYSKLKKTIVINLLNFNYYKRNSYHQIAHMKFEKTKEKEYVDLGYTEEDQIATEDIEMHFIEMPKLKKKKGEKQTKLEQWLWLLIGEEEKIEMASKENKEIKKALEILDEMSMDEKEWEEYQSRFMAELDYNSGIATARADGEKAGLEKGLKEGKKEGIKENKIEIAKKLIKMNMDLKQIKEITGLSIEELENIKSNIDK